MRKRAITLMALIAAATLSASCGGGQAAGSGHPTVVNMGGMWSEGYTDLHGLKKASDLAAEGTIIAIAGQTTPVVVPLRQPPFTDFRFRIDRAIYDPGSHVSSGDSVLLHQTGVRTDTVIAEDDSDPLFNIGERYVLFLHEYSAGRYYVIGGPNGRFPMTGGMVQPMPDSVLKMPPTSEASFIGLVQAA